MLAEIGRTACDLGLHRRHPPGRRDDRSLAFTVIADEAVQLTVPQQLIADDVQSRRAFGGRHTGRSQSLRQLPRMVVLGELRDVEVERVGVLESIRQGGVARVVDQRGGIELVTQLAPLSFVVHRNADPVAADARVAAVRGHVGVTVAVGQQLRPGEVLGEQAVADHR